MIELSVCLSILEDNGMIEGMDIVNSVEELDNSEGGLVYIPAPVNPLIR